MSDSSLPPYQPGEPGCPLVTADLPGIGGHVELRPEHFIVDEVPAYAASGEGQHTLVQVRKRGMTTHSMVRAFASAMGVKPREIGSAGRKDRHAITTQWLTLPGPVPTLDEPNIEVLGSAPHRNKLKMGHLKGNRFQILITQLHPEAKDRLPALLARVEAGLPNYFGGQRFGAFDNVGQAMALLNNPRKRVRDPRFLASALQSAVFNRWLGARIERGQLHAAIDGDVLRKRESGGLFNCEDVEIDLPRVTSGEVDPTGPMIGPKMRPTTGAAAITETVAAEAFGLDEEHLATLGRFAPGARRVARILPGQLEAEWVEAGLKLSFFLPKGAYATMLLTELIHPTGPLRPSPDREA